MLAGVGLTSGYVCTWKEAQDLLQEGRSIYSKESSLKPTTCTVNDDNCDMSTVITLLRALDRIPSPPSLADVQRKFLTVIDRDPEFVHHNHRNQN